MRVCEPDKFDIDLQPGMLDFINDRKQYDALARAVGWLIVVLIWCWRRIVFFTAIRAVGAAFDGS